MKLNILSFTFLFVACIHGGQNALVAEPGTVYSQAPFNLSTAQLPPHFAGHDVVALYNAFQKVTSSKRDEYETSAQFEQRRAALSLEPLIGDIGTTSILAFVVPVSNNVPPPTTRVLSQLMMPISVC